jgi:ribosomal protein S18 acetylase RimI-like enzyme
MASPPGTKQAAAPSPNAARSSRTDRPHVGLRPATDADHDLLLALFAEDRRKELEHLPLPDDQKAAFLRQQFDAQRRGHDDQFPGIERSIIVADGHDAGRLDRHREDERVRVVEIMVAPAHQGRGIGTAALARTIHDAGSKPVVLSVEATNEGARRLYGRLGFRVLAPPDDEPDEPWLLEMQRP